MTDRQLPNTPILKEKNLFVDSNIVINLLNFDPSGSYLNILYQSSASRIIFTSTVYEEIRTRLRILGNALGK